MHSRRRLRPLDRLRQRDVSFRARIVLTWFPIQLSNSQRSAAGLGGAPAATGLVFCSQEKKRGAERRQALVRNAAPGGPPRGGTDLRVAGDHRPDRRPARLSALCCGSSECLSAFAQLRSALACPDVPRAVSELLARGS